MLIHMILHRPQAGPAGGEIGDLAHRRRLDDEGRDQPAPAHFFD